MATINVRSNHLIVDFRYKQQRCRETTGLADNVQNRKKLQLFIRKMEAEITLGTFEYARYFPNSSKIQFFSQIERKVKSACSDLPLFSEFAEIWYNEKKVEWRKSYKKSITSSLYNLIIPKFSDYAIDEIKKSDILLYRSDLAKMPSKNGGSLSGERINKILMPLRMILNEGAERFDYVTPWQNIKPLKVKRPDIQPFSLDEVLLFLSKVRADFKNYYTVRFFTGLRTSEVDGLTWENVDFERKQILVRHAFVLGELIATKTDGSYRTIDMSQVVFESLKSQLKSSQHMSKYVFCNGVGNPLNYRNVSRRVWHPTLRYLDLKPRRSYQTRHTAATLWLASGESIEWIARQMGHVNSSMIIKVYSRFVPNMTRQDGSAFEALLENKMKE